MIGNAEVVIQNEIAVTVTETEVTGKEIWLTETEIGEVIELVIET